MARVRGPLHAISASGSVGPLTFIPTAKEKARTRNPCARFGFSCIQEYPARITSGEAIVRRRLFTNPAKKKDRNKEGIPRSQAQRDLEGNFRIGAAVAKWLHVNKVAVSRFNPKTSLATIPPYAEQRYTNYNWFSEISKFPGQAKGLTLEIRKDYKVALTPRGYLFRQLFGKRWVRYIIISNVWRSMSARERDRHAPQGDAPLARLPAGLVDPRGFNVSKEFIHFWIVTAYLGNRFELLRNYPAQTPTFHLWTSDDSYLPNSFTYRRWLARTSGLRDFTEIESRSWSR